MEIQEKSDKEDELLEKYSDDGKPTGKKIQRGEAHEKGIWHPVTHNWISDQFGNLIVAKRSKKKKANAGLWDVSSAGHCTFGDTIEESAIREIEEELGLKVKKDDLKLIGQFKSVQFKNNSTYRDFEYVFAYHIQIDDLNLKDIKLQKSEVGGFGLMHYSEVKKRYETQDKEFVNIFEENEYNKKSIEFAKEYFNSTFSYLEKIYGNTKKTDGFITKVLME